MSKRVVARSLLLIGVGACGPSVSAIYESNARFEHCERLDLDPEVVPTHRRACWEEWSQRYTVGQTTDRFDHARERIAALDRGETETLRLVLPDPSASTSAAAAGLNPTRAPPAVAPVLVLSAQASTPAAPSASAAALPQSACGAACAEEAEECRAECGTSAHTKCSSCDKDYTSCMRRCFR